MSVPFYVNISFSLEPRIDNHLSIQEQKQKYNSQKICLGIATCPYKEYDTRCFFK